MRASDLVRRARSAVSSPNRVPRRHPVRLVILVLAIPVLAGSLGASPARSETPSAEALELRNRGLAELENEQPAKAEEVFRELAKKVEDDPLPQADLAVALLRQQKMDEALQAIQAALEKAPGRPDLLAIEAEVLQWSGRESEALARLQEAVRRAPEDLDVVFSLYRLASILQSDEAKSWERQALDQLARMRPENVVVLSALGRRAIARGDRAGATGAYLRLRELAWQGPAAVGQTIDQVLEALKQDHLEDARVPAQRLENVLKITPMYQQSQRELTLGIQGVPVSRFVDEPPPVGFGPPAQVTFRARSEGNEPSPDTGPDGLAAADLDGDGRPDPVRLIDGPDAREGAKAPGREVEIRLSSRDLPTTLPAPPGAVGLLLADLDNDGHRDLVVYGPRGTALWRGDGRGNFAATAGPGLGAVLSHGRGTAAAVLDFDIEGDLDLALFGFGKQGGGAQLYRNDLQGPLEDVGAEALPAIDLREVRQLVASDLDRDGDMDLLAVGDGGLLLLDNLRQGRFAERTRDRGLAAVPGGIEDVTHADLDNDGRPELVLAVGEAGLVFLRNPAPADVSPVDAGQRGNPPRFTSWSPAVVWPDSLPEGWSTARVVPLDADHDGRLDLAAAGEGAGATGAVVVLVQRGDRDLPRFEALEVAGPKDGFGPLHGLATGDTDGDGDLDLLAAGDRGLFRLENVGGNRNPWLIVRLRGLDQGNSKNNLLGVGSTVEVFAGAAYQFREADGRAVHFGLGSVRKPDMLRVTWTNGVPQDRLQPETDQVVAEEQVLKGSCPFLYTWDGDEYRFVTDLLWGAPAGLPLAPGVWADADPQELVLVEGARPAAGGDVYRLVVTEELWEAAFFDRLRLWVVDHPREVEVASNLRIVPGEVLPEKVLGTRDLRPVTAVDGRGRDVTREVAARDEVYADGYTPSRYQGVATEPWTFTFDLGEAPSRPVRLLLDGWIFPTDASLNLALAQRSDLRWMPPRLEVETADGWQVLMENPGFPAGKTKTLVLDTPPLPPGAHRLRLVTTLWLHWDRIAWSVAPADGEAKVVARLDPATASLHYRGFSEMHRTAPNGPHVFDYTRVRTESPWEPFPGRYTRYGDVRELLLTPDDRSVILGAGDAMDLTFDASHLPPPPPGWERTVFLESHGWDKDADRNTWEAQHVGPLPFRAMSGYPYGKGESFPDTPLLREYREKWLTREVKASEATGGE
jgi:Flp pilus assembly protein TadD